VIPTFYEHTMAVNDVAFHPSQPILASASKDKTIKFFNYSKPLSVRRSQKHFEDSHNVRSLSFHPSGNYLLAGTDSPAIHLYDVNNHTTFCYTAPEDSDNHTAPITRVQFNLDGDKFVSSSKDGSLKIWDGTSNR